MEDEAAKQVELANACYAKGRKLWGKGDRDDALTMFRKALAIQESALGTYHKNTARTYYWVGFALKYKQEYDKALVAYRRTLRIRISLLGIEDVSTEDVKRAMGDVLMEKAFDAKEVKEYFSQVAESVKHEKQGESSASEGDYDQAVEEYEACLVIEEKALGKFPLDVARMYSLIGGIHVRQEEPDMAITAYREALSVYESTLGQNHPDTLACIEGIEKSAKKKGLDDKEIKDYCSSVYESIWHTKKGDAYNDTKEFDKAIAAYEVAVDIEESYLGSCALSTARIYRRMAFVFSLMNYTDRAIMALRTVLTIYIFECGSDHHSVITTLKEIGQTMKEKGYDNADINKYLNTVSYSVKYEKYGASVRRQGDYEEALGEFQKSLALEKSALGKYHLTQAALFRSIGNAFSGQAKYDHALFNYRQSLMIFLSSLGDTHFETKNTLKRIGYAAEDKGMSNEAVEDYKVRTCKSIGIERTGDKFAESGKSEKAITTYLRAISLEEASLGPFHLCTAGIYTKIANTLKLAGCHDRALAKCREVLAMYEAALGVEHLNSQKAKQEIKLIATMKGLDEGKAEAYSLQTIESIRYERNGDNMREAQSYDKAIADYNRSIQIEEEALGHLHLTTVALRQKIADCIRLKGHLHRAILLNKDVIRMLHANAVPYHGDSPAIAQSLDLALQGVGFSPTHALKYRTAARESVKCEANGDSALQNGKHEDALQEYRRAIVLEETVLGKLHLTTATLYQKMANVCRDYHDFQSATILYSKALGIFESHMGKESPETVRTYNDLLNVAQKEAAVTKSNLEGWMTLNYILMGLIGLLVLIATVVKSLTAKQMSVKKLKSSSLTDRIEESNNRASDGNSQDLDEKDQRGENSTGSTRRNGQDPDGTRSPISSKKSALEKPPGGFVRRKSLDPPQWGFAEDPEADKFARHSANDSVLDTDPGPRVRRGSNNFHATKYDKERDEGEDYDENEDDDSCTDLASEQDYSNTQEATDDMDDNSLRSSEAELNPEVLRRFRNIKSQREDRSPERKQESKPSTQEVAPSSVQNASPDDRTTATTQEDVHTSEQTDVVPASGANNETGVDSHPDVSPAEVSEKPEEGAAAKVDENPLVVPYSSLNLFGPPESDENGPKTSVPSFGQQKPFLFEAAAPDTNESKDGLTKEGTEEQQSNPAGIGDNISEKKREVDKSKTEESSPLDVGLSLSEDQAEQGQEQESATAEKEESSTGDEKKKPSPKPEDVKEGDSDINDDKEDASAADSYETDTEHQEEANTADSYETDTEHQEEASTFDSGTKDGQEEGTAVKPRIGEDEEATKPKFRWKGANMPKPRIIDDQEKRAKAATSIGTSDDGPIETPQHSFQDYLAFAMKLERENSEPIFAGEPLEAGSGHKKTGSL